MGFFEKFSGAKGAEKTEKRKFSGQEEYLEYSKGKLGEMKAVVSEMKEGVEKNKALTHISNFEGKLEGGELLDLKTVKDVLSKYVFDKKLGNIDLSDAIENVNKGYDFSVAPGSGAKYGEA